jgi:enterochelin esterase family protein
MTGRRFCAAFPALLFTAVAVAQMNQPSNPPNQTPPLVAPSPVVQPDGKVTFTVRAPNAVSVKLSGDYPFVAGFHGGRKDTPLTRDDKGNWSVTVGPLKPDLYNYAFDIDGVHFLDPQNVHVSVSSSGNGTTNWLIVPGPVSNNYMVNDVPHGRVSQVWYSSPTLSKFNSMPRRVVVYTPPGYETGTRRYPVFYLYHGGGENELTWSVQGRATQILDNLIAQGKTVPMIVVMPSFNINSSLAPSDATARPAAAGPGQPQPPADLYAESVARDLIPFMDRNFRTIADRDHRAVAGTSAGGAQAAITGFRQLDSFSWLGLLSPALARIPGAYIPIPLPPDADVRRGPDLGVSIDPVWFAKYFPVLGPDLNKRMHLIYFSVGGAEGLLEEEKAGAKLFDDKGIKYTWMERPGYGHEWAFWRQDLQDFSAMLFKTAK